MATKTKKPKELTEKDILAMMNYMFNMKSFITNDGQTYECVQPVAKEIKVTIPNEGHTKFFVANARLGIYTSIGADNMHHASNKCTKLFGPNGWSFLRSENNTSPSLNGYEAKPYKEFKELINTLSI